ncbi:MAG TPA: AMP-dependent synthetase [Chloroflexi bacterium]|nr:AMP-dependent synthetase [Chloroflexota bacterium]
MLRRGTTYRETVERFRWEIPEFYNIALDICDKHAGDRAGPALIYHDNVTRTVTEYTFHELKRLSDRLASNLRGLGLARGDRIGIILPQRPETALTHLAAYKLGAVTIPLFTLFGPDALEYRLRDSGARMVVVDDANLDKVASIRSNLPSLETIIVVGDQTSGEFPLFADLLARGAGTFTPVSTRADDPALIIYTSGTTGPPKGALHAHRVLLGHLPGFEFPHNFAPQAGDCFWTPADWAWIGGLIDVLFPAWHHGLPVVAHRAPKFDPEEVFALLAQHRIRNAFLPPTALKMMREVPNPGARYHYSLRTVGSGGEALGEEILEWGKETLGVTINEFYGQTEVNLVVGNCHEVMEIRPGSMGRPVPGHEVVILQEDGTQAPIGTIGEIGVRSPDPVMFLGYWQNPEATAGKYKGDWLCTGDLARQDTDGYFWFVGRKDDLIISSGYRIGPTEVEDTILKHPAVAMVAVVGAPHEVRGTIVKAFVRLKPGFEPGEELARSIQDFVKTRLAAHEYPREIAFVESLPMTATGKIMRRELRKQEEEAQQRRRSRPG